MSRAATSRLLSEYRKLQKDPAEYITAHPLENNVLEWHFVLIGPPVRSKSTFFMVDDDDDDVQ